MSRKSGLNNHLNVLHDRLYIKQLQLRFGKFHTFFIECSEFATQIPYGKTFCAQKSINRSIKLQSRK